MIFAYRYAFEYSRARVAFVAVQSRARVYNYARVCVAVSVRLLARVFTGVQVYCISTCPVTRP